MLMEYRAELRLRTQSSVDCLAAKLAWLVLAGNLKAVFVAESTPATTCLTASAVWSTLATPYTPDVQITKALQLWRK